MPNPQNPKNQKPVSFFSAATAEELLKEFMTSWGGLSEEEAALRIEKHGYNEPAKKKKRTALWQLLQKFTDPLVIILLVIATFSLCFGEDIQALLVLLMIFLSVFLSFFQEYKSNKEAEKLSELVRATATVNRDGKPTEIKMREIVPGDIVDLYAGDMIPADLRILSCKDLFINQSSLTGESFPIEKIAAPINTQGLSVTSLTNIAFMGSSVVSGTALGLVIKTGIDTQFGEVSRRLANIRTQTSFDKGVNRFVWLMIKVMMVMVAAIFVINLFTKGDWKTALLFSLAVAVGLTPEMLPMLVTINLSKGAIAMSKKKVIVKRLNSIQNLGAMNVICTDKTGTLTLDDVVLERHCDVVRAENEEVLKYAFINSFYQTGLKNLLDRAILKHELVLTEQYKKEDEIPFDFSRRIMSVIVEAEGKQTLISKGAPEEIFKRCSHYELDGEILEMENLILSDLKEEYDSLSADGFRVLAVAYKNMPEKKSVYSKDDEKNLVLIGYLAFLDPPKPSAKETIHRLKNLGIEFKVLTGDNELVTKKICSHVGLDVHEIVTGDTLEAASDITLRELVKKTTVFARLSPLQKERVIHALHENGQIVGYLGDGINDAPALKTSDVGISVNNAVDIAKESADIILLEKSLLVLEDGVLEGRRTFGNIMKYIKMGSSSNFGNMISMTGASLFLPFLPMLPIQILFNNFLYDVSQIAIPTDKVDDEYLKTPKGWDIAAIRRFMLIFGPISSLFDFLTFGILLFVFHASQEFFHTGWFLESLCTQTFIIYIIRTAKIPFLESRPSRFLVQMSLCIVGTAFAVTLSPWGKFFGFVPPTWGYGFSVLVIVLAYLTLTQKIKSWYVKKYGY
ncbi:MAG: magnesium-translocating P-type ATPase [Candidatus Omnitrophota bacterium]